MADWTPPEVASEGWAPPEVGVPREKQDSIPRAPEMRYPPSIPTQPFKNPFYEIGRQFTKLTPQRVVKEGAAVLDIVGPQGVAQVATNALGTAFGRAFASSSGVTDRDEINRIGAEFGSELASNPLIDMPLTRLVKWAMGDAGTTTVEEAMEKVTEALGKGGEWAEKESGRAVRKADVDLVTSVLFARLGIGGYGKLAEARAKAAATPKVDPTLEGLNADVEGFRTKAQGTGEDLYAKAAEGEKPAKAAKPTEPPPLAEVAPTLKKKGFVDQYGKPMAVGAAGVGAALALGADSEDVALATMVGIPLATRAKRVTDLLPDAEPLIRKTETFGPSALPALDSYRMGLVERGAPPAALAAFDDYVKGVEKLTEPYEVPGLLFPASHDPERVAASLAVLPLAAIIKAHPNTTFKDLIPHNRYTTKTLQAIEKELSNRNEITRKQLDGFLGRSGISAAEKELFAGIMAGKESIFAKDLIAGVREATGDFELKARDTQELANYGLDSIDRTKIITGEGLPEQTVEEGAPPPSRTTIYQSPVELGTANHFRDPNYFAHTRSFDEGGVRHVVEIQSDLAQKAGKKLTEGERARLQEYFSRVEASHIALDKAHTKLSRNETLSDAEFEAAVKAVQDILPEHAGSKNISIPSSLSNLAYNRADVLLNELSAKLGSQQVDSIRPILKDWWKRLIREEVAQAAENPSPERIMRFATADTVAKVEGWPDLHAELLARRSRDWTGPISDRLYADHVAVIDRELAAKPRFGKQQGIYDRYKSDIESFLRKEYKARDYTDPQGHTWLEADLPPDATPIRLWGMGAAAAGAALTAMWLDGGDESPLALAALAATPVPKKGLVRRLAGPAAFTAGAAGLAYYAAPEKGDAMYYAGGAAVLAGLAAFAHHRSAQIRQWNESGMSTAEALFGTMSTGLRGISEATLRRVRDFEWSNMTHRLESLRKIEGAVDGLLKLPRNVRDAVDIAFFNSERSIALNLAPEALRGPLRQAFDFLDEEGAKLVKAGLLKSLDPNYWPRSIKDLDGLLAKIEEISGKEAKDFLERKLADETGKKAKTTGDTLNDMEVSTIINEHLQAAINRPDLPGQAGMFKKRAIKEVRKEILPFYETAADSIAIYARGAAREIERAKFFGKDLVRAKESNAVMLDASIGRVVKAERDAGKLTDNQLRRLETILRARFGPGERSGNALSRTYRNIVQALLLGNPYSAMVQFGDIGTAVVVHGAASAVTGVIRTLIPSARRWGLDEMGLVDHVLHDFDMGTHKPLRVGSYEFSTAKFLQRTLKLSGFSLVDSFAKLVNLNAAAHRFGRLTKSERGRAEIASRYGEYFKDDLPQLIRDLQAGKKSRLVGELIFGELSDVQPITMIDKPLGYAMVPSARPYLTMKGFMVKQISLVWERGLSEIRKGIDEGNKARILRGASFLTRYALAMGLSGAGLAYITKWMQTGEPPQELPDAGNVAENVFKTFGWSSFALEELRKGNPTKAAGMVVLPPWRLFDDLWQTPSELRKWSEGDEKANPRGVSYFPLVGKDIYLRALGGNERRAENEERRKRIEENRKLFEGVGE